MARWFRKDRDDSHREQPIALQLSVRALIVICLELRAWVGTAVDLDLYSQDDLASGAVQRVLDVLDAAGSAAAAEGTLSGDHLISVSLTSFEWSLVRTSFVVGVRRHDQTELPEDVRQVLRDALDTLDTQMRRFMQVPPAPSSWPAPPG
jgi:hypothetical protein